MSCTPVKDRAALIAGMNPKRIPGTFVFVTAKPPPDPLLQAAVATYVEPEGISLIVPAQTAMAAGFDASLPMACITLQVHSALDGVGLTAAVATALADANIPCNMVAAYNYDHAYVPEELAERALDILNQRSKS